MCIFVFSSLRCICQKGEGPVGSAKSAVQMIKKDRESSMIYSQRLDTFSYW